ncbi:hypothetical protein [Aquimarina algiphila]|uniref:hypothetical protein n=1 Tax=Aquimarina algiphila TaxID=2047982 RepID=UPI00232B4C35|nr:hypothetical protein [Aquimarina algiphila]
MLEYDTNERPDGSHFFIRTQLETLHILKFSRVEPELISFENDFLQNNIFEMEVVRVSELRESYCKSLVFTIKHIFDSILFRYDNRIIYISVPTNSLKHQLIESMVSLDDNDEFNFFKIEIGDLTFCFFMNSKKINILTTFGLILQYFVEEYDINLQIGNLGV